MKKYLTLPLVTIFTSIVAQDLDQQPSRSVFKISPQHFTQRQLKAGFERFNRSYSRSFSFYLNGLMDWYEEPGYDEGHSGLGAELQYRKYLAPLAARTTKKGNTYYRGIYFSGYLQGAHYSGTQSGIYYDYDPDTGTNTGKPYDYKEDIGNWGFGFTFGFQQTLWSKIFFEVYVGGGLQFADQNASGVVPDDPYYYYFFDPSGITALDYQGIMPKIGLQIGIGL
jgi:hypothetical protein